MCKRLVVLMAQEELLSLRQEDIGEPCKANLVISDIFNVKLAVKLVVKVLVRLDPFVSLAKAFGVAQFLDEGNLRHLFYS